MVDVTIFYRTEGEARTGAAWKKWSFATFERLPVAGEYLELLMACDVEHAWYRVELVCMPQLRGQPALEPPARCYVTRVDGAGVVAAVAAQSVIGDRRGGIA